MFSLAALQPTVWAVGTHAIRMQPADAWGVFLVSILQECVLFVF